MTIERQLKPKLLELAGYYPVTVITGPRQSGKTTLSKAAFPDKQYVSLEPIDKRSYAIEDPRGFLEEYKDGAIIDEVQHAPDLLSYLQDFVDQHPKPGRFILTGSQNLILSQSIAQSMAGRCGILTLLPPSWSELAQFDNRPKALLEALWQGHYPRIYDQGIPAQRWLADYTTTYLQRDVRQITQIANLNTFTRFLKLIAGHTAQEVNFSRLSNDIGITHNTARSWLSVLETSWLGITLPAWHNHVRKQVIKAPKWHFLDTGLVCSLLGIRSAEELRHHPQRGAIFESWVVAETLKQYTNRGDAHSLYHYRESRGLEIDLIAEAAGQLNIMEIKSGSTINSAYFKNLKAFVDSGGAAGNAQAWLVYGGEDNYQRQRVKVTSWDNISSEFSR